MCAKSKKILLLNPPAREIVIRDYYCSFSSKAGYYWPPQDLVVLSGILSNEFDLRVIDAIGRKMDFNSSTEQLLTENFDAVIFSTGTATLENDARFIEKLKLYRKFKAIASSAIFEFCGEELLNRFGVIDAVLIDFFHAGIIHYLNEDFSGVEGMMYKSPGGIIKAPSVFESDFSFAVPRHELFAYHRYRLPFCAGPTAVVITSIGCPFGCKFCTAGHINFRIRESDNLLEEIRYIKGLGINNIFFASPTFTYPKDYSIRLCEDIIDLKINWICNAHPSHLLDEEFVLLLKRAGCRMIMIGVESGNSAILRRYSKSTTLSEIKAAFEICRKNHIATLAYFIIGFPEEDERSILETVNFTKGLNCDFLSVDFATPDFGTELREELIKKHVISSDFLFGWDPSGEPVYPLEGLSIKDLVKLRNRAYRDFYLRPSYIKRSIFNVDACQLKDLIRGGLSLFLKR